MWAVQYERFGLLTGSWLKEYTKVVIYIYMCDQCGGGDWGVGLLFVMQSKHPMFRGDASGLSHMAISNKSQCITQLSNESIR